MRRLAYALLLSGLPVLLTGCGEAVQGPGQASGPVDRGPAPSYREVMERYNQRLEPLESLWSRTVVRVWYPDQEGEERTEQVEGWFQFVRPRNVNLTLTKVGETAAVLGSNETRYWWMELGRGERKAHVGEHAKATPERIAEMGLPLYPLDLIELTGITPLPVEPGSGVESPSVRWGSHGRELIVNQPLAEGVRRLVLDPKTFEPLRMEVVDGHGVMVLASELSNYTTVAIRGGRADAARVRVPGEVLATFNRGRTQVRMRVYDPETGGSRPRPGAFDFESLVRSLGVRKVINLDEQPVTMR